MPAKSKPTTMSEIQKRLVAHILAGGAPKEFSVDNGMHQDTASKMLAGLGIRKVFVTEAEHVAIMAQRKAAQAQPKAA
jgi:hypothetical protein